jgi:signal transduction histidine kinase
VEDTGSGISEEHLSRIFDPFFTTKPVGEGTGLGLAVVRAIVQEHGGSVTVASEPGHGASFTVFLPPVREEQALERLAS